MNIDLSGAPWNLDHVNDLIDAARPISLRITVVGWDDAAQLRTLHSIASHPQLEIVSLPEPQGGS